MDEKRAMEILGLEKGFSRGDVKNVYRNLAKTFHPDRYGSDDRSRRDAEARMVDINLAASVLIAAAPVKEAPEKKTVRKSSPKKEPTRPGPRWWGRFFSALSRRRPRPAARAATPRPAPSPRRTPKNAGFAEVFETCLGKKTGVRKKSVKRGNARKPVDYGTYLAMKRRMKRRSRPMDAGRVEPVSPVSPVTKISN